ncbi:AtpZ/AtpI family protein [Paracidobacterium acidisoli]|uniref:AtpZ/AtpI family protein n=1 Tax=Paracidobacterium acidisoli TaxID=2303751 RepID=A0A372ITC3_9BACT|nr:AtpZ/AtpI family protein [Paracidobacterium acidisoli]MBT9330583.1 AtpZ/AtpI family protein [Paracidobacterium acidisoli]
MAVDPKSAGNGNNALHSLVQAERLVQIAIVLPAAVFIGWAGGTLLDHWLHQHWIYIPGLLFGVIAGLVEAVRQALRAGESQPDGKK